MCFCCCLKFKISHTFANIGENLRGLRLAGPPWSIQREIADLDLDAVTESYKNTCACATYGMACPHGPTTTTSYLSRRSLHFAFLQWAQCARVNQRCWQCLEVGGCVCRARGHCGYYKRFPGLPRTSIERKRVRWAIFTAVNEYN